MNAEIEELKNTVIPGESTRYKVRYLIENYPHFKAKEMSEVLGVKIQVIHTAKWALKKDGLLPKSTNQKPKQTKPKKVVTTPPPLPLPQYTGHIDIWDQEHHLNNIEPPYQYEEQYTPPPPVYIQPQGAQFEINTAGVDGVTVKSLIKLVYDIPNDNRKYKLHIKIEEE